MSDSRNIIDKYKGWQQDLIRDDLARHTFPFATVMSHWGDFNFSTMIRNSNAFGAKEVFYYGQKKWDRRGAQGVYHYTNVNYLLSIEELRKLSERYILIGIDNVAGSVSMVDFVWPANSLMIFGSEGQGIEQEVLDICSAVVEIPMYGSVRSLNCGTASGIAMYDYVLKFKKTAEI